MYSRKTNPDKDIYFTLLSVYMSPKRPPPPPLLPHTHTRAHTNSLTDTHIHSLTYSLTQPNPTHSHERAHHTHRYCDRVYSRKTNPDKDIYLTLLSVYMSPKYPEPMLDEALKLLCERSTQIDNTKVWECLCG